MILMTSIFFWRFYDPGNPQIPAPGVETVTERLVSEMEQSGSDLLVYEDEVYMRTSEYTGYFILRNSFPSELRFNITFSCSDCGQTIIGGEGVGNSLEWVKSFSFTTIKAGEHRILPFKVVKPPAKRGTYHLTLTTRIGPDTYAEYPLEIKIT